MIQAPEAQTPRPLPIGLSRPDPSVEDERDRPPTSEFVRYVVSRHADASLDGPADTATRAYERGSVVGGARDEVRIVFWPRSEKDDRPLPRNAPLVAPIDLHVLEPAPSGQGRQFVVRLAGPLEGAPADELADTRAQMNGLGYLASEWRAGDAARLWYALPIDRRIPAVTPFTLRLALVGDDLRRLPLGRGTMSMGDVQWDGIGPERCEGRRW